jgi:hypothetical protein
MLLKHRVIRSVSNSQGSQGEAMKRTGFLVMVPMLLAFSLPVAGKTYKYTYPTSCGDLWGAVRLVLADEELYAKVESDDAKMTADYAPKHTVHMDVSGVLLQRMNHVTLLPKGKGCEMDLVSNFSGWGHEDQGDFKKRVDDALVKPKEAKPASDPSAAAGGK